VKAALVAERKAWRWGSARWRDEYSGLPWQRDGACRVNAAFRNHPDRNAAFIGSNSS